MSELLTIEEVATILNVSPDTVTRRFSKVTGVIDIGSPETPKRRAIVSCESRNRFLKNTC